MNTESMGGGSVFILILLMLAIAPLLWLALWGYQMQNLTAFMVSMIFFSFIILTLAFDFIKYLAPSGATYGQAALSFSIGLIIAWALNFNQATQSIFGLFTVPQTYLLSSISGQLPVFWNYFVNIIGAAVSEETLFLISIPITIFIILKLASKSFEPLGNEYLQLLIVAGITGLLFAIFHIGNLAFMSFIISAIIFRTALITIVHGERETNLIPFLAIVPSFAVGYHMGNNWGFFGFFEVIGVFMGDYLGWVLLTFIFSSIILGFRYGIQRMLK